ncbi:MAG TPA: hypothetical protein VGO40_21585, partial [Longimicrobium sp.]|nr:hypothetical protein [Longimicrobium sp.]
QDASSDVAYSRAQETVELLLLPLPKEGLKPRTYPYHRLRLLFGLEPDPAAPDDAEAAALAARAAVAAAADADRPRALLAAFRRLAALDEIGLRPATLPDGGGDSLFPADDDCRVLLATVTGIVLKPGTDGKLALDGKPLVDPTVRPSHVATSTIQELTCGGACCAAPAPAPPPPPPPPDDALFLPVDAGGPRIASAALTRAAVVMQATAKLAQHSVTPAAFSVSRFDPARGWTAMKIGSATVDAANRIMLAVGTRAAGAVVRVIARGTGPTPVLGEGLVPLAGAVGGPPGTADDGHDFVIMLPRSHP